MGRQDSPNEAAMSFLRPDLLYGTACRCPLNECKVVENELWGEPRQCSLANFARLAQELGL